MKSLDLTIACLLLSLFSATAVAQTTSPKDQRTAKAKADAATQIAQIKAWVSVIKNDQDPAAQQQALTDMMAFLIKNPGGASISEDQWLPALLAAKHYQEIIDATTPILHILANNSLSKLEGIFPYRIQAQVKLGKTDDALISAKQFYNIASMKQTAAAISWVAQALKAAHPEDPGIADRFRAEQQAAASPAAGTSFDVTKIPPVGSSILDSIKIDSTPYDQAAELLIKENYPDLARKGNYALLADKPADAKDYFERAYAVVPPKWITESVESIARSIRAEHRNVGAANAWIMSLKTGSENAPPSPVKTPADPNIP